MSREYADIRIREALKIAKGNPAKARQQVIAWTIEDHRLLQALAKPHLKGIVAHAINHAIYNQADSAAEIPNAPQGLDMTPDTFGKEILKALQSRDTARFGSEGEAPPARRPKASQSHIDALNQIAGKKPRK